MYAWLAALMAVLAAVTPAAAGQPQSSPKSSTSVSVGPVSVGVMIRYINGQLRQIWDENKVSPSQKADDAEWLRRVFLDVLGHIPPADEVEKFLADEDPAKRSNVIERLLDDPAYVRNWTTIWTNLSIGQQTPRRVSRSGMRKFYREAFGKNRPWNEVVHDIVSAEGHFERNGAVNFLLAQMTTPDDAVQATAKTMRLFMGIQVQCTQCHDHPFNDWKQNQFWEFNSFFRQTRKVDQRKYDPQSGRRVDDYSELVSKDFSGPVYFENRKGLMKVAYPKFFETKVDDESETDRRKQLATLMLEGKRPWIATAMVNRMWGHFFGYGFTKPVDDMGPHNPPAHPELLDRLTDEFVQSGYDLKQLIRWICNSEAYHLTSRFGENNAIDNPANGQTPLFSHLYLKSMEAEQLYDSLLIATSSLQSGRSHWKQSQDRRGQWLRQFVIAFGTDENDESTTFNGTIPQALMMMNGPLIENAVSAKRGSFLYRVLSAKGSDAKKIRQLYLSTLSRRPSRRELNVANKLIRAHRNKLAGYQDLFWALLNSNEFMFNH